MNPTITFMTSCAFIFPHCIMSNFDDMNVEPQFQVACSANAQLRDQIDALNRMVWSLEERLRISDEGKVL